MMSLDALKNLFSGWWAAAAGGAVAGATLFPESRVAAGALGGAAVLAFALWRSAPCCEGCAAGQGCGGTAEAPDPHVDPPSKPGTVYQSPPIFIDDRSGSAGTIGQSVPPLASKPGQTGTQSPPIFVPQTWDTYLEGSRLDIAATKSAGKACATC